MDTTKTNIQMCEKAEEIQKLFNPEEFNFLWDGTLRNSWDKDKYNYNGYRPFKKTEFGTIRGQHIFGTYDGYEWGCIWLPTQSQLQEMVKKDFKAPMLTISSFLERICMFVGSGESAFCESMEQLWLAFVMKEKYNKIWDGKEWINVIVNKRLQ